MNFKRKIKHMLIIISAIIVLLILSVTIFINQPEFGRQPSGNRLERILKSPNYRNGKFQNQHITPQMTSDKGFIKTMFGFLTRDKSNLIPDSVPVIKTDLHNLNRNDDIIIWFGHSSYLIQIDGKRFLIDPVFCSASPIDFFNRKFNGTGVYTPDDIPEIDYLIITHDHWDHLDYQTVSQIRNRTHNVICPLGVGEDFEYWKYSTDSIIELDWFDRSTLSEGFSVHCLPSRHFSGRSLKRDQTLWASFMLETPTQRIYIGGDGGYDSHFANIGKLFAHIDLAILENGQYNQDWRYIHTLPQYLPKIINDLKPTKVLTVHHSKYSLSTHSWKEPLHNIEQLRSSSAVILSPMIGEPLHFKSDSVWHTWWK